MIATTPNEPRAWLARLDLPTLLPGGLLAALMLWSVFRSIADAGWAAGLDIVPGVALLGLLAGIIFARLPGMPAWLAHPLAVALGAALAVERVGPALVVQVRAEFGPDVAARLGSWGDYAAELAVRALVWGRVLAAGGRGEDIALFVLTLALLAWALGYLTGWLLFRAGAPWLAVALCGVTTLLNYTFAFPKPDLLFFVFLAAALLLLVLQNLAIQQQTWRAVQIEFPDFLAGRFLAAAAIFSALVIGLTALIPGSVTSGEAQQAWNTIRRPFAAAREAWNDAFSTISAPAGTSGSFVLRGVQVGGPRNLGEEVVMRVRSARYDYWRAVAFDRYSGRQWQSTVGERARAALGVATAEQARSPLDPLQPVPLLALAGTELVTQTVTLVQARNDGVITHAGQLRTANLPVLLQHGYVASAGEALPNFAEIASVVTDRSLQAGQVYTVTSLLSNADEQSLRAAGQAYPEWVRQSYLQLPETLPARVRERARQVAEGAGASNPYDVALAIQAELRRLTYDERREAPPEGRDWVDFFLFDGRRGYCDDFATAMVVLLRSEGVPARWVQGYAGGTLDPDGGEFVVRESVAHSWVEAYFPGFGWQRFEPTPAPYASMPVRPALPEDADGEATPTPDGENVPSSANDIQRELEEQQQGGDGGLSIEELRREAEARAMAERLRQFGGVAAVVAVMAALAGAVWLALGWGVRGLSPAQAAFAKLARLAGWAGLPQPADATPYEYGSELKRRMPDERRELDTIVDRYVAERYGRAASDDPAPEVAWRALRAPLLKRLAGRLVGRR
jgi:hypothetical protein